MLKNKIHSQYINSVDLDSIIFVFDHFTFSFIISAASGQLVRPFTMHCITIETTSPQTVHKPPSSAADMFKSAHSSSHVSRDGSLSTPFASRKFCAKLSTDYPEGQHRSMSSRQDYYSLSDPHLTHYFRRKLLYSLEIPQKSRVASSLSFRSTSK